MLQYMSRGIQHQQETFINYSDAMVKRNQSQLNCPVQHQVQHAGKKCHLVTMLLCTLEPFLFFYNLGNMGYGCYIMLFYIFCIGFSDPYCLLTIMEDEDESRTHLSRTKPSKSVVKDAVSLEKIYQTDIKVQTLNPIWNQTFIL